MTRPKYSRYHPESDTFLPPKVRTWGIDHDHKTRNRISSNPYPTGNLPVAETVNYYPASSVAPKYEKQVGQDNYQSLMFYPYERERYPLTPYGTDIIPLSAPNNVIVALTLFSGPELLKWTGEKYITPRDNRTNIRINYIDQIINAVVHGGEVIKYNPLPIVRLDDCRFGRIDV